MSAEKLKKTAVDAECKFKNVHRTQTTKGNPSTDGIVRSMRDETLLLGPQKPATAAELRKYATGSLGLSSGNTGVLV